MEKQIPIGTVVHKDFVNPNTGEKESYRGVVQKMEILYLIQYDDGDTEHLTGQEVLQYQAKKRVSPKSVIEENNKEVEDSDEVAIEVDDDDDDEEDDDVIEATTTPRSARAAKRRVVNYADPSDEDDDDDESSIEKPQPKKKRASKKRNAKASKKKKRIDSDSEVSLPESEESEDEELFAEVVAESSEEEEESPPPSKSRAPRRQPKKKQKVEKQADNKKAKKKMSESFQPLNNPTYPKLSLQEIQETKDYLDSCGMEATDDIIDGLVGAQVDKILGLLDRALKKTAVGTRKHPLQLGTACSGTDAPALALTLVQEQLELRGRGDLFNHSHVFSCENEPFKQAYLARNFDSILYPDITRLVNQQVKNYVPSDVYGQEQSIPPFNMFVAGTSCKNFSMLRSKFRIDIEDKGCSGETFLAATEVLFQEQPQMAIFENVTNAPWAKMSEYITGRVKLSACADAKAIKEIKAGEKNKELTFVLGKNKEIIVDFVPAVYGVRCGAVVKGFVSGSETKIQPVQWPKSKTSGKQCVLSDLIRANKMSKDTDVLVFKTECVYCTQIVKVDTKEFGLPQTRQRVYMFVWRPHEDNINDDLGTYWVDLVKHLKSPVRHSMDSFMLQDDHEAIRLFREALNGPPGRQSKRACFLEADFWASVSANLPHNKNTREALGMGDEARWLMNWGANGKKQIPPSFWLEYFDCNLQREIDMMDILYGSAMRDAEMHDPLFCSYYWNISQNVTREKHRTSCPGIAGCCTPGGDFVIPHRGRPLLGCEKLLMQGLPYFRLMLGIETEVQLGDLAGNAMSLTVVCATMLAALTCNQLRQECVDQSKSSAEILKCSGVKVDENEQLLLLEKGGPELENAVPAERLFETLASMAKIAARSSIFCTCETSGRDSLTADFLRCEICGVSCCRNCISEVSGYNLSSHTTKALTIPCAEHKGSDFHNKLRNLVPPTLELSEDGWSELVAVEDDIHRVSQISGCKFSLHRIKRDRQKWTIIYYARGNHGIGEAVAELRIDVGEVIARGGAIPKYGMAATLTSYMPARTEPRVYNKLLPCARRVVCCQEPATNSTWMCLKKRKSIEVLVKGKGDTPSPRLEVGLKGTVLDEIKEAVSSKKDFIEAKKRGEIRRWLYPSKWKSWPKSIVLSDEADNLNCDDEDDLRHCIFGEYERAECRQTTNQSGLWVKKTSAGEQVLYIIIRPNVNRTGPDRVVISSSINHEDASALIAEFPDSWQPSDAHLASRVRMVVHHWESMSRMRALVPESAVTVVSGSDSSPAATTNMDESDDDTLVRIGGLTTTQVSMFCRGVIPEDPVRLNVEGGQQAQQVVRVFNSVCVAPILRVAASGGLKFDSGVDAKWMVLPVTTGPFGHCKDILPPRPSEEWLYNDARNSWERRSNPREARKYYMQLHNAKKPFELWLDPQSKTLSVKFFPHVVAHHAAYQLIHGRGDEIMNDDVEVSFKLSDILAQSDPIISPFSVGNCNHLTPTEINLCNGHSLYDRQKKVVTKMLAIERGEKEFEELEIYESQMPGSTGLSAMAKATRQTKMRGGVIADAIGAGKTVVSIALILAGIKQARASKCVPRRSAATLVVVPPALIDQWASEIKKFSNELNVVKFYDLSCYKSFTLSTIINADVCIVPVDILESPGYFENLLKKSKLKDSTKDIPKLPTHSGQVEQNAARGVWIPNTSTDPYGGGNNKLSQRRRDQSAFFTYRYAQAIEALRKLEFDGNNKNVPLEYFEWERLIVDEVHESLCTTKGEMNEAKKAHDTSGDSGFFNEKNRRAGRELLGITQRDTNSRPLVCRRAVFGLTGTPLLDSSSRVIELANLMGGTYVIGLSSHWRKLERESSRDIFLHNYLEPKQSREVRKAIHYKAQEFLDMACCRNKSGEEMAGITLNTCIRQVRMDEEERRAYLKSQSGISEGKKSLAIIPDDFDVSAGHDVSRFLRQNTSLDCRGRELVKICREVLDENPTTKIVVFTDGKIGGGVAARRFLQESGLGCTWLDHEDSVEEKNKKIGYYQHGDATEEDRQRPRVLVLHFDHAAGLNLQSECFNLILFSPLYVGVGGSSSDPVADASTELQAVGRVFRAGQPRPQVNVYRIEVRGPKDEHCMDHHLILRNTDEDTIQKAVNAGDD